MDDSKMFYSPVEVAWAWGEILKFRDAMDWAIEHDHYESIAPIEGALDFFEDVVSQRGRF